MHEKPLDSQAKALLTAIAATNLPSIDSVPLDMARVQVETGMAKMNIPVKPVSHIADYGIEVEHHRIPIRVYYPEILDYTVPHAEIPTLIFFHGGGWVFFTLDSYDSLCTHLCAMAKAIVISVDYRRSPEYRYPVPVDDCVAATEYILTHSENWNIFSDRFYLVGDSAGGNLAAVTAMKLRDLCRSEHQKRIESPTVSGNRLIRRDLYTKISGQILLYPVTDYYSNQKPSHLKFSDGYGLSMNDMVWFWKQYLENEDLAFNPYVSPLQAEDLSELPPALVIVSGYDPLRDEGILYGNRLQSAGVKTRLLVYDDMIHGFLSYLGILKQAIPALKEVSSWIREAG